MRIGYMNNFKTTLAMPLASAATEMTLESGGADLLMMTADAMEEPQSYMLTLSNAAGDIEIIEVTAKDPVQPNLLTVIRGREGTAPRDWAGGDIVQMRLTARSLNRFAQMRLPVALGDPLQITTGTTDEAVVIGSGYATGEDPILIGMNIGGSANRILVMGWGSYAEGDDNIVLGNSSHSSDTGAIGIGSGVDVHADHGVGIGSESGVYGLMSVAIGHQATCGSEQSIAIGGSAVAQAPGAAVIGFNAKSNSPAAVALGTGATANPPASMALGAGSLCGVLGGVHMHGLPYLSASYQHTPELQSYAPDSTRQASMQVVIATTEIDLASGSSNAALQLPPNTIFLIDSLDWITTASDTPGGTPQIQVGTDETDNATLLAASEITATGLHQRQTFEPLHSNGVTSVYVSVATAGTGTLTGKLVVRGYVMEV